MNSDLEKKVLFSLFSILLHVILKMINYKALVTLSTAKQTNIQIID